MSIIVAIFLMASSVNQAGNKSCESSTSAPFTLNDAAPCLRIPSYREKIQAKALAGDPSSASLLVDYYLDGAGDDRGLAILWMRQYLRNGGAPSVMYGQMLIETNDPKDALQAEKMLTEMSRSGDVAAAEVFGDYLLLRNRKYEASAQYFVGAVAGNALMMEKLSKLLFERSDNYSHRLAIYWMLEASKMFKPETYRNKELKDAANAMAAKSGINIDKLEEYLDQW